MEDRHAPCGPLVPVTLTSSAVSEEALGQIESIVPSERQGAAAAAAGGGHGLPDPYGHRMRGRPGECFVHLRPYTGSSTGHQGHGPLTPAPCAVQPEIHAR